MEGALSLERATLARLEAHLARPGDLLIDLQWFGQGRTSNYLVLLLILKLYPEHVTVDGLAITRYPHLSLLLYNFFLVYIYRLQQFKEVIFGGFLYGLRAPSGVRRSKHGRPVEALLDLD